MEEEILTFPSQDLLIGSTFLPYHITRPLNLRPQPPRFLNVPSWRRRLFHVSLLKRCGLVLRGFQATGGGRERRKESPWQRHLEGACEPRQHQVADTHGSPGPGSVSWLEWGVRQGVARREAVQFCVPNDEVLIWAVSSIKSVDVSLLFPVWLQSRP